MFGTILLALTVLVAYSGVRAELVRYLEGCDL